MIFEFMSDGFQIKVKKHSRSYGSRLYEEIHRQKSKSAQV